MNRPCEVCGRPIPAKRLKAKPDARLCVPCVVAGQPEAMLRASDIPDALAEMGEIDPAERLAGRF